MDWSSARERLGAELIGAREAIARSWRQQLAEQGQVPRALEPLASELLLHAAAALADGMPPETPWTRCGGTLRLDARHGEQQLPLELTALFSAATRFAERLCFSDAEERLARDALGSQLEACLRGAAAEARTLLHGAPPAEPALRFGGVKLVCFASQPAAAPNRAA